MNAIKDMRALSSLNLASNHLGLLASDDGWTMHENGAYCSPEGEWQGFTKPDGVEFKPLGGIALADAIPNMGALTTANIMGNNIGKEQLSKLQEIMHSKPNLISLCGIANDATEADLSGLGMDDDGAIILASELPDKGVLTSLNLAENNLGELVIPEGWTWDEDEEVYRHTDGREQKDKPGKPEGIIAIANAIPDMRAISSVNLLMNNIPMEQAKALASILKEHPTLKSLCGNSGEEAELDMSGKEIGAEGAIMLAPEIAGNGAMTSLNLAWNDFGVEGVKYIAAVLPKCT
jgi:hypothetical protein